MSSSFLRRFIPCNINQTSMTNKQWKGGRKKGQKWHRWQWWQLYVVLLPSDPGPTWVLGERNIPNVPFCIPQPPSYLEFRVFAGMGRAVVLSFNYETRQEFACPPHARTMLVTSVSFQCQCTCCRRGHKSMVLLFCPLQSSGTDKNVKVRVRGCC